jgi:ankyrin repeat protein
VTIAHILLYRPGGVACNWSLKQQVCPYPFYFTASSQYQSALHLAVIGGHRDVVALLLKYHATPGIRDTNGLTPLQLAENSKNSEIVTLIEQHLALAIDQPTNTLIQPATRLG